MGNIVANKIEMLALRVVTLVNFTFQRLCLDPIESGARIAFDQSALRL